MSLRMTLSIGDRTTAGNSVIRCQSTRPSVWTALGKIAAARSGEPGRLIDNGARGEAEFPRLDDHFADPSAISGGLQIFQFPACAEGVGDRGAADARAEARFGIGEREDMDQPAGLQDPVQTADVI